MATKKDKEDMALGLGRYYESERQDIWGKVNGDALVGGMSSLTDPSTKQQLSSSGGSNISGIGTGDGGSSSGTGSSNYTVRSGDTDTSGDTTGNSGLSNTAASLVGAGTGVGLSMAGVPFGSVAGNIFGGLLGDKSGTQIAEGATNSIIGSIIGSINPVAGLVYSGLKVAGLNIGQGLNEQFGNGMTGIAPGYGGGYFGKKGTGEGITGGLVDSNSNLGGVTVDVGSAMAPAVGYETGDLGSGLTVSSAKGLEAGNQGLQQSYEPTPPTDTNPDSASITDSLAASALNMANAVSGDFSGGSGVNSSNTYSQSLSSNAVNSYGGWSTASAYSSSDNSSSDSSSGD